MTVDRHQRGSRFGGQPFTMAPAPLSPTTSRNPAINRKIPTCTTDYEINMSIHSIIGKDPTDENSMKSDKQQDRCEGTSSEQLPSEINNGPAIKITSFSNAEHDMMRESDADILERGVCDDTSNPTTPFQESSVVGALIPPPLDLENYIAEPYERDNYRREVLCRNKSKGQELGESDRLAFGRNVDFRGHHEIEGPGRNVNSYTGIRITQGRSFLVDTLSGDPLEKKNQVYHSDSTDSSSDPINQHTKTAEEYLVGESARSVRDPEKEGGDKKYHRRLHEAALFKKVVGEYPKNKLIQLIIDDDDDASSSDEDSDDENHTMGDENLSFYLDGNQYQGLTENAKNTERNLNNSRASSKIENSCFNDRSERQISSTAFESQDFPKTDLRAQDSSLEYTENRSSEHSVFLGSIYQEKDQWECSDNSRFDVDELQYGSFFNSVVEFEGERLSFPGKLNSRVQSEMHLNQMEINKCKNKKKGENTAFNVETRRRSKSFSFFRHHLPLNRGNEVNDRHNQMSPGYKGIRHNPPEVTKRGISRGNYVQLHRKAWLEVSDQHHRYGKNLRLYYKHWESLGHPTNMFFDWLDSKGEAEGWEKPSLKECPRSTLDHDCVLYITDPKEQEKHRLKIFPEEKDSFGSRSKIVGVNGKPICTGPNGWIFVLRDNELYGSEKVVSSDQNRTSNTKFRFHHSSFFGGKAVAAAGILITDEEGYLKYIYPHSGHYRPGEAHMQRMLYYLYQRGTDLHSFEVDMQQIMHVSREKRDEATPHGIGGKEKPKKSKKTDSLCMKEAYDVAVFLGHKARSIENLFTKIHQIRRIPNATIRSILETVDKGGLE